VGELTLDLLTNPRAHDALDGFDDDVHGIEMMSENAV
jgi:hypothetical protein